MNFFDDDDDDDDDDVLLCFASVEILCALELL